MPFSVICSPSHTKNMVPAAMEMTIGMTAGSAPPVRSDAVSTPARCNSMICP